MHTYMYAQSYTDTKLTHIDLHVCFHFCCTFTFQDEGVKIFIQLYKEITLAVDLGSGFAIENLRHPNIVVSQYHGEEVHV